MMTARSYFHSFLTLFLHLGCFIFFSCSSSKERPPWPKRRKISPSSPTLPLPSNFSPKPLIKSLSIRSYLSRILPFRKHSAKLDQEQQQQHHPPCHPPVYSSSPLQLTLLSPDGRADGIQSAAKHRSFPSRDDVHPCPECGEVLSKPQLLDLHHATKHSLSELCDADSGYNIVRIIFESGWKGRSLVVHRILKIHNTTRTLARFEEYRDAVRSRAARYGARNGGRVGGGGYDERCIADGNERLRFYCTTSLCSGSAAPAGSCWSPHCCACAVVRHGFSGKKAGVDGIATHATGWDAHASRPEDLEREFAFLGARRAILVCRVVAGRVARGHGGGSGAEEEEKGARGFDSLVPMGRGGGRAVGEDELVVFSPRAVLPCFVIIYTA